MSNPDIFEKRLQSWSPRQASDKVARDLFETGRASQNPRRSRSDAPYLYYLWHWLTPVAACCLTVLVTCSNNSMRRVTSFPRDNATYFATVMLDTASSNVAPQTFALSK